MAILLIFLIHIVYYNEITMKNVGHLSAMHKIAFKILNTDQNWYLYVTI